MLSEVQAARLALAQNLRQSADHSSEQELRDALSRSYYSIYHAARVWVGKESGGLSHDALERAVRQRDAGLADELRGLYRLREKADYDPDMVARDYGDVERFQLAVSDALGTGRAVYLRICNEIQRASAAR